MKAHLKSLRLIVTRLMKLITVLYVSIKLEFVFQKGGCYMFLTIEILKHLLTFHGFIKQQNI
jgi:hypothetical protein